MCPSLNDLPDVCLLAVFKYLSLVELLRTIRLVNTRWSRLLPAEMVRRRSLVIVDDFGSWLDDYDFRQSKLQLDQYQSPLIELVRQDDGLTPWSRLPQIDSRNLLNCNNPPQIYDDDNGYYIPGPHYQVGPVMVTTLVDTLPRISSLTVAHRIVNLSSLDQITRLIDHWRDHLVTLKLYLYQQDYCLKTGVGIQKHQKPLVRTQALALFDSINRALSLKHLTLGLNFGPGNSSPFTAPLTILSQLSTLYSDSRDLKDCLFDALRPYASANRALQIGTIDGLIQLEEPFGILRIDPQFCDRFRFVNVWLVPNDMFDGLNLFCARFSSLVHLRIDDN